MASSQEQQTKQTQSELETGSSKNENESARLLDLRSPMLAPSQILKPDRFTYPMLASVKMDGIRAIAINGKLYSRTGKLIPNLMVQNLMKPVIEWAQARELVLDGELWSPDFTFQQIMSVVMARQAVASDCEKIWFNVFDSLTFDEWASRRMSIFNNRNERVKDIPDPGLYVRQHILTGADDLREMYKSVLDDGYEGLIVRSVHGVYKWGRCTIKENNMFKLKHVEEIDAVVSGYEERMTMSGDAEREYDVLGRPKPVYRQSDRVPAGDLGALIVMDEQQRTFCVGSGFTAYQRRQFWQERGTLIGRWIKLRYATAGVKDLPRHPVFVSFRDPK